MSTKYKIKKQAQVSSVQPLYRNPSGETVTSSDIVSGKKKLEKGYKPASVSDIVSDPNFGKKK
jgi:hypothetical protein